MNKEFKTKILHYGNYGNGLQKDIEFMISDGWAIYYMFKDGTTFYVTFIK